MQGHNIEWSFSNFVRILLNLMYKKSKPYATSRWILKALGCSRSLENSKGSYKNYSSQVIDIVSIKKLFLEVDLRWMKARPLKYCKIVYVFRSFLNKLYISLIALYFKFECFSLLFPLVKFKLYSDLNFFCEWHLFLCLILDLQTNVIND